MRGDASWLENVIAEFIASSPENSLRNEENERAWDQPLVGFSRGDDPLYPFFKEDIGPFYWTPEEIMSLTFPGVALAPGRLTVISWVLPHTAATRSDNAAQKNLPAERWSRARNFGEDCNHALARHVVSLLAARGIMAVAPTLSPLWAWQEAEKYGFASNWSERHAAYVSGLGTFGLCDGLITRRGKAMRCGSVVAALAVEPTPRPYTSCRQYCLFYSGGKCRKCAARCPVGAVTDDGHDKEKCRRYLFETAAPHAEARYGFASYGCGLCQTGVPCEAGIPAPGD